MLCTVDLFPASSPDVVSSNVKAPSASATRAKFTSSSSSPPSSSSEYGPEILHYHYQQERPMSSPNRLMTGYIYPPEGTSDVVYHLEGFPITENSKQTQALVGATFVQPSIIDYQGKKAIVFVFAVRRELPDACLHSINDFFDRIWLSKLREITAYVIESLIFLVDGRTRSLELRQRLTGGHSGFTPLKSFLDCRRQRN